MPDSGMGLTGDLAPVPLLGDFLFSEVATQALEVPDLNGLILPLPQVNIAEGRSPGRQEHQWEVLRRKRACHAGPQQGRELPLLCYCVFQV